MKTWELIKDFQMKMPKWVRAMQTSEHNYGQGDSLSVNPYHAEDVWTHTCMVVLMAEQIRANRLVMLAALLHDVGKPASLEVNPEKQRHSFIGHEGLSAYMALEYLRHTDLTTEEKIHVVQLISLHIVLFRMMEGANWEQDVAEKFRDQPELLEDLIALSYCDHQGRFSEKKEVVDFAQFRKQFEMVFEFLKEPEASTPAKSKTLTLLVGPPNAGKSTWIKHHAPTGAVVLCRDQVILDLAETDDYTAAYAKMDKDKGAVDAEFSRRIQEAIKAGQSVVIDMTSMSPKSRRRSIAPFGKNYAVETVVFMTAPDLLYKRNQRRHHAENKFIPERVIQGMMQNFTVPMPDEGLVSIEYVIQDQ